jgi:hypothetical protein
MTKFSYLECAVFAPILIAALAFSGLAGAEAGMNVPVANLTNASLGSGAGRNELAGNDDNTLQCESNDGRRKYCGPANYNQVSLQRQLSSASCVQGESWGVDGRGLWVDRGCRAIFYLGGNGQYGNNGGYHGGSITCESNDGQRKYCGRVGRDVRLQRQLSQSPCVQGQSWGVDGQGLWVDRGCRAEFSSGGGNWDNNGGNNGGNYGGSITCESNNGQRKYCGRVGRDVQLQRQLSQSPCVQGQSWGVDGQGLWVDRGCRAEFSSGGNWDNGNGNWNGNGNGISDYPRVSADTSGHGNFSGNNFGNAQVTRGWVNTRSGQPSVSLSGSGGFKITFYGVITQADDRHMTMRINNSNKGRASGRAEIYLNGEKNEVESVTVNGNNFSGTFSRN